MAIPNPHWNVQVMVQMVVPEGTLPRGRTDVHTEKRVLELVNIKVTAQSEAEAYQKAIRLIEVNQVQMAVPADIQLADDGSRRPA